MISGLPYSIQNATFTRAQPLDMTRRRKKWTASIFLHLSSGVAFGFLSGYVIAHIARGELSVTRPSCSRTDHRYALGYAPVSGGLAVARGSYD